MYYNIFFYYYFEVQFYQSAIKVSNKLKNRNIRIQSDFIIGSKTKKDMPLTLQLRRFLCIFKTIIGETLGF